MSMTASAIGLLTRQYRAVLKKCFLMNMGLFALGVISAISVQAETLDPIDNYGIMGDVTGDFINNVDTGRANGGAIYNSGDAQIGDINGNFINNQVFVSYGQVMGGAIYNSGTIGKIKGSFSNNISHTEHEILPASGGAIKNYGGGYIESIDSDFSGNKDIVDDGQADGGAISNSGVIGSITGDFTGNSAEGGSAAFGGAIYNTGTIKKIESNFSNNVATGTGPNPYAMGGAVANYGGGIIGENVAKMSIIRLKDSEGNHLTTIYGVEDNDATPLSLDDIKDGNYVFNVLDSIDVSIGEGGDFASVEEAVTHYNAITESPLPYSATSIEGNFDGNKVKDAYVAGGAAIVSAGAMGNIQGNFSNNTASSSTYTYGGVVYNAATMGNINGDFINNSVSVVQSVEDASANIYGGVILNGPAMGNITGNFTGNTISATGNGEVKIDGSIISNNSVMGNITGDFKNNTTTATAEGENHAEISAMVMNGSMEDSEGQPVMGDIKGDFIGNTMTATSEKDATIIGIVGNSGTIGDIESNFDNNTLTATSNGDGVAGIYSLITNEEGTVGNIKGNFTNNLITATSAEDTSVFYGMISKMGGTTGNIEGDFTNNNITLNGKDAATYGIIANGMDTMGNISGDFKSNTISTTAENEAAIYGMIMNESSTMGNIEGDFADNTITAKSTGDEGGAYIFGMISNMEGEMGDIKGNFINNTMTMRGVNSAFNYGMITNMSENSIGDIIGDFKNNTITATATDEGGEAAAYTMFYSGGGIGNISGEFSNNTMTTSGGSAAYSYGLIFNYTGIGDIINSSFKDNTVTALARDEGGVGVVGGMIISGTNLNIIAKDGYESVFSGNYEEDNQGRRNEAITMMKMSENSADLTLRAETGGSFTIDDKIVGLPEISNETKRDEETGKRYYVDENGDFFTDENGNKLAEISGMDTLINPADARLLDAEYSNVNITGDGTGVVRLHNDIVNLHTNVSNTTLDVGTSTVNVKDINFAGDSTLAVRVNSLDTEEAFGDHGRLNASDGITIENGAKLKATLSQKAMASAEIGDKGEVTLLTINNVAIENNTFKDKTIEEDIEGNPLDVSDNNMYSFEKKDGSGTYVVTKIADAKDVAKDEIPAGENAWVADATGAWVDGNAFAPGSVSADIADKMAELAQHDAAGLVEAVKTIAPSETAVVQATTIEQGTKLFKNVDSYLRGESDPMGFSSGDDLDGVSIWGKAYIGESRISRRGNIAGSKADSEGVILGLEKKLDNTLRVGAGLQFDKTKVDAYRRDTDIHSTLGFIYGEYKPSDWFVNGVLSYGGSNYDEKKYALGTQFNAKYDAHIASLAAMTGYQYGIFTPEMGLRYYHITQSGYTDTAGQSVKGDDADILRGVVGVMMSKAFGIFKPEVYLGITYDLATDKGNTTVNLANGSSYMVQGKKLDKLGYEANIGVATSLTDNITASLSYLGAYRKNYKEHTGMVNVKYSF